MRVKGPAGRGSPLVVVVAVTEDDVRLAIGLREHGRHKKRAKPSLVLAAVAISVQSLPTPAAVLAEDRADLLYHSYEGGGAEISGPSLLIRKKFSENVSASFNHYVDHVSSASIDVVTTASPYTEEREENSLKLEFLSDKIIFNIGVTQSSESDYDATTYSLGFSQDMFGDLTTLSMGFSQGDNEVGRNGDAAFAEDADWRSYRVGVTQVLTRNLVSVFSYEAISDEGFLNNPYRSVRYVDPTVARGYSFQAEVYPNTRTSNAFALRAKYYLAHRAALHVGYRYFDDSWGIKADTFELGYTWPYSSDWTFEFSFRDYDQSRADFYSDLFAFANAQNFLARDKELSSFTSRTLGIGASYTLQAQDSRYFDRFSLNLNLDTIDFVYEDFRDLTLNAPPGSEPLYKFDATVIRFFISAWF